MGEKSNKDPEVSRTNSLSRVFSRRSKKGDKDKDKKRISILSNKSRESVNSIGSSRASTEVRRSVDLKQKEKKEKEKKKIDEGAATAEKAQKDKKDKKEKTKTAEAVPVATESTKEVAKDAPEPSGESEVLKPVTASSGVPESVTAVAAETAEAAAASSSPVAEEPIDTSSKVSQPIASPAITSPEPTDIPQPSPISKSSPIPVADERQPLLPQEQATATSNYLSNPLLSIGLIVLVIIVLILFFFVYNGYSVDIQQSIHPQLSAISLVGINDVGLKVKINCSVSVDYNVSSVIFQNIYKTLGVLLGPVLITPYNPINVRVNDLESFNIISPAFTVSLHDKAYNEMNFETTVGVNDASLIELLNELANNEEVAVNFKSVFYTDVKFRHISLHHMKFDVDQDLVFNNNLSSNLDIQNSVMDYDSKSVFFRGDVGYASYYFKDVLEEFNDFDLALICDNKWSKIGNLQLEAHEKYFSVNATIDQLTGPKPHCVSRLIEDYSMGKSEIFVSCKNKSKYRWLDNILSNVYFRAPFVGLKPVSMGISDLAGSLVDITVAETVKGRFTKTVDAPSISVDQVIELPDYNLTVKSDTLIRNGILVEEFELLDTDNESSGTNQLLKHLINDKEAKVSFLSKIKKLVLNGNIEAKNLQFNDTIELSNHLDVNDLNTSVLVDTLVLTGLTPETLSFRLSAAIDLDNVKLNVQEPLEFDISANKSIGEVHIAQLATSESTNIDLTISKANEQELTQFVNRFISGDNQTLDARFTRGFFTSVDITDIQVPAILFQEGTKTFHSFVLSSTIHILTSEVELLILNPIINQEINVDLQQVTAIYEDEVIGELGKPQLIMLPGGVSKVDKIPIKLNRIGADIVRKALNGKIEVTVVAKFRLFIEQEHQFSLNLEYKGNEVPAEIRL